jgi:hypothetical protein
MPPSGFTIPHTSNCCSGRRLRVSFHILTPYRRFRGSSVLVPLLRFLLFWGLSTSTCQVLHGRRPIDFWSSWMAMRFQCPHSLHHLCEVLIRSISPHLCSAFLRSCRATFTPAMQCLFLLPSFAATSLQSISLNGGIDLDYLLLQYHYTNRCALGFAAGYRIPMTAEALHE